MLRNWLGGHLVFISACLAFLTVIAAPIAAQAQQGQEELSQRYGFPDLPEEWQGFVKYRNDHFSFGTALGVLFDYSMFAQDEGSEAQMGRQDSELEARSFRFVIGGTLDFLGPVVYLMSAEYKGFNRDPWDPLFYTPDLSLTWQFQDRPDRITFGKQKEPFIYEMIGDAANLPHHERLLEPFYRARNTGIRYTTNFLDQRSWFSLGWFNDWWHESGDFSENGNQYVARLTGLPLWLDSGARFLHLGVASRYTEGDNDVMRYQGMPGSHVTDFYVDSGDIAADHAWHMGLEALWQSKQFAILGEYARAWVSSHASGDPVFSGWYVTTSYVFNGRQRPYDKAFAYARRVQPFTPWGAVEPVLRYGRVDLDDGQVAGGEMEKWYLGLNWWATPRWKMSFGYGSIDLDRFGMTGRTEQMLLRLQWIGAI
ncbi:MAG: porin [Thermodesulfobacteriota bacterium]